jgi:hypothetical protein
MSDHSIYLRVSGVYIHEITQGLLPRALNAHPLPMCNVEASSMVPSVTSVHVTYPVLGEDQTGMRMDPERRG